MTVSARTRPGLKVAFVVRTRSDRLLGAVYKKANAHGVAKTKVHIRRWRGESLVKVSVTVYAPHHAHRVTRLLKLSSRQQRLLSRR
jgi:hypothetical protein